MRGWTIGDKGMADCLQGGVGKTARLLFTISGEERMDGLRI
jgi:hypothetical protein